MQRAWSSIMFSNCFQGSIRRSNVGCGVGTWLAVLLEKGVGTVRGYDGPWVQANQLVIPRDSFQNIDLGHPEGVRPDRRFDLAICLEVAEHLPPERAGDLVHSLCSLSDIVLFSAAIPGQGGVHHVNEQWPAYWAARFAGLGYKAIDTIRFRIWEDDEIPYWYRQNLVVYAGDGVPRNPTPGVGEWGATPLPWSTRRSSSSMRASMRARRTPPHLEPRQRPEAPARPEGRVERPA